MSIENIIIYILLPALGYVAIRINRLEKRVLTLIVMLRDRGFKIPSDEDTKRFLKADL
ncbi:MAG: hypothetical protein ABSA45_03220 [Verrucomicrobiota bacterium]|jgi:hypothetical protein